MSPLELTSFFGTYTPRLDDKGRMFLPAKFRPRLENGVILTRGQENCIYGWTMESFAEFTDQVRKMPITDRDGRNFSRMLYSGASSESPDKQGRISVPAILREWAQLDKNCVVIGAMDRIEIWDAGRWADFSEAQAVPFAALSTTVMPEPV